MSFDGTRLAPRRRLAGAARAKVIRLAVGLAIASPVTSGSLDARAAGGLEWFQAQTLTPSPTTANAFGAAVALSGDTAVVGAPDFASSGAPGAVYVYVQSASGAAWSLQQVLTTSDPEAGSLFGEAVAIEGDTILVGAPQADGTGAAYVFTRSAAVWSEQPKLVAASGSTNGEFGDATALASGAALVGDWEVSLDGNVTIVGGLYAFTGAGGTWTPEQLVMPADETFEDGTATRVAASGSTAVTASPSRNVAYVLTETGGSWVVQQELQPTDSPGGFGGSFSLSGSTLAVGSSGTAYLYAFSGSSWSLQQEIPGTSGAVAVSGATLLLGDTTGTRVFAPSGSTWVEQPSELPNIGLGPIALDGTSAILGGSGVAYVATQGPANGGSCTLASECGSGHCVAGVCCDTSCGPCGDCATGVCTYLDAGAAGTPVCAPFTCTGSSAACPIACAADSDCTASDYCPALSSIGAEGGADGGEDGEVDGDVEAGASSVCTPKKPLGAGCAVDHECASDSCVAMACRGTKGPAATCAADDECAGDHCVDGVCCDSACSGQCEACDVASSPGVCAPVTGAPHGSRPACAGTGTPCAGTCDGVASTTACEYASATLCGTTCTDDSRTTSTCDGTGRCVEGSPQQCPGDLGCNATGDACLTACSADGDCASGFACQGGACVPRTATCSGPHTAQGAAASGDAGTSDCTPYLCDPASGTCRSTCVSAADCVAPDVCDLTGHCVPAPATSDDAGCACRQSPGAPATPGSSVLVALGALALGARRRTGPLAGRARRGAPSPGRAP